MIAALMAFFVSSAGPIAAFCSSITWAIGTSGYSRLARNNSAFAVNFARALVALPLFAIAVLVTAGGWSAAWQAVGAVDRAHAFWLTISIIASYGLGDSIFYWSTRSLGVPAALAIGSTYPIWTALAGFFFAGESFRLSQILGLLITAGGIAIVLLNGPRDAQGHRRPEAKGVFLAFVASLFWAINGYATSRGGMGISTYVGNLIRMAIALGVTAGLNFGTRSAQPILMPARVYLKSLWFIAIEAFGGSCFYMYGLAYSPLSIGPALSSLAPVLSVPVAWALGLEKFSLFRTIGICTVVLGLCVLMGLRF